MDDVVQLDQYMSMVFDEVETEKKKKKEELEKEVVTEVEEDNSSDDDWWLEEDAFGIAKNDKKNPFGVKK